MGHDAKAGRQGAVYADAKELSSVGDEVAEVYEALIFGGAGVDALPADGGRGNLQQT